MKKHIYAMDLAFWLLLAACLLLAVVAAVRFPLALVPLAAVLVVAAGAIWLNIRSLRRLMARLLYGTGQQGTATQLSLARLSFPVLVVSGKQILWYNEAFRTALLHGEDACLLPLEKVLPGFDEKYVSSPQGQNFEYGGRRYTVFGSGAQQKDGLFLAYFVDDTTLKRQAGEYIATRPAVMMIALDTYDELTKEMKDSDRARVVGEIDLALEQFIGATTGFLRRMGNARYIAVVEERHMQEIVKNRFSVLDTVREIGVESGVATLSIGVGRMGETLRQCEEMASQALDMALGRGGDQAAVKSPEGFEFYGGVSRGVEKRSRVRSRIIANALRDLILQSENVLIVGHKMSDLDCMGAAAGVWRMCRMCHRPAAIVVDDRQTLASSLIEELRADGCDFIRPEGAENDVGTRTLVIIVDTHLAALLESRAVYERAKNVVVIDHHRRCVGYIEDAVIFYHEPAASSASEMVSELVQYITPEKDNKLTALEAQALLAGIMLDTRDFALHTGVRTFEAAAYLRRMGAQTAEVKKLFNSSFDAYAYRAQLVTSAEIYQGCAVVVAEHLPADMQVVVPQAANDLLTIEGVQASFVAVDNGSRIVISARSMGEVNVQLIMEKLGGGGHLTMAGVQLPETELPEIRHQLLEAIAEYRASAAKK